MSVSVLVPSIALLCALALTAFALRGRRVDHHPVCRRCGFDLFGKPPGSTACAECGADLNRRRAVRVGNRERRRGLAWVAASVLLLSLGWLGAVGWREARRTDWNRHKPVAWLVGDAAGRSPAARDAALAELVRRIGGGRLADDHLGPLVGRALDHQADAAQPWVPAWGELVEAAHRAKRVSPDQWKRYRAQAMTLTLEVPEPRQYRGDAMRLRLLRGPDRVAAARFEVDIEVDPNVWLGTEVRRPQHKDGLAWSDTTVTVPPGPGDVGVGGVLASCDVRISDALQETALGPGAQTARLQVTLRPVIEVQGLLPSLAVAMFAEKNHGARRVGATAEWTLLRDGEPRDAAATDAEATPPQ